MIRSGNACPSSSSIKAARSSAYKGAPDLLLDQCSYILWEGNVVPLTGTLRQKMMAANEAMARHALRVLALAYRDVKEHEAVTRRKKRNGA